MRLQPEGNELPLLPMLKADTHEDCCGGPSNALTEGPCSAATQPRHVDS